MMLGAQNEVQAIKQSFHVAVTHGELFDARVIASTMQQKSIVLSFMEQMALLGELAKLDAQVGYFILNCGAFRQELIFVGMTCLSNFKGEQSPFTIPLVEKQLIKAIEQEQFDDAKLILSTAKWCIHPTLKIWAYNKANGVENTYEEVQGIMYVNKTYLPRLTASMLSTAQPIIVPPTAIHHHQRRLTH